MKSDLGCLGRASFPDISSLKVLIVDDLAFSRNIAKSLLMAAEVRHIEMASGITEAWRLICAGRPDLLILDWEVAEQSGIDLLRLIRTSEDGPTRALPVLMITAYREERRVREAISSGVSAYLIKPFTSRDFILKVKQCVETSGEAAAPEDVNFVSL